MNTKETNDDTINFSFEVHLLVDKLVPVVAIHSLGGSRANRHHTPNWQPGVAQPTQDGDHTNHAQSTRVAFGAPLGKAQEPLTITTIRTGDNHLPLFNDPPITGLSRCRQTPRVTRSSPAQIAQLAPQDARTLSNALEALQSHSNDEIKCASEWIVFAQLPKGVLRCGKCKKSGEGRPPPSAVMPPRPSPKKHPLSG